MIKGGRALTVAGCVAAAACAQTQSVKVRAIADPAIKDRFGGDLLADARGQLALGDVGIALETFQTLARQQPENPDAYAGIAACYEAMGRFDIARQNYEMALAFAPNDPALLLKLAGSLDQLGATDQASRVRAEAARLRMPPVAAPVVVTPSTVKQLSSVTVKLPPAVAITPTKVRPTAEIVSPVAVEKGVAAANGSHLLVSTQAPSSTTDKPSVARKVDVAAPAPVVLAEAAIAPRRRPSLAAATLSTAPNAPRATGPAKVAIPLPLSELLANSRGTSPAMSAAPARKVVPVSVRPNVEMVLRRPDGESPAAIPPARPADRDRSPVAAVAQVDPRVESGPRLRRESQSEVSLITTPQPVRYAALARPRALSAPKVLSEVAMNLRLASPAAKSGPGLTWVPLKYASATDNIQLLNAARSRSLAAHVRMALLDKGWRKIGIGNAPLVRQHSLVLYSPARVRLARRLAAQFHCKAVQTRGIKSVLVLLGRDAALARRSTERA